MYYNNVLGIHDSALKHGISPSDAILAATQYLVVADLGGERELRLGFDSQGTLLETVVLRIDSGKLVVIHAMSARRQYLKLLERRTT